MQTNYYSSNQWPPKTYTRETTYRNGNKTTTYVTLTGPKDESKSIGSRLPNFQRRLKSGELLPFGTYTTYDLKFNPGHMAYSWRYANGSSSYLNGGDTQALGYQQLSGLSLGSLLSTAVAKLPEVNPKRLVQQAASQCYAQGYDALTSAGELGETIAMFRGLKGRLGTILAAEIKDIRNLGSLVSRTSKQLVLARKNAILLAKAHNKGARLNTPSLQFAERTNARRIRALERTLKDARGRIDRYANGYLEVRYGWRPFFSDMMAISKALANPIDEKREIYTNHARQTDDASFTTSAKMSATGGTWVQDTTWTIRRETRGTVSARFKPSQFQFNPVVTTWQLVRLSFVVDWFLSIGAALNAASLIVLSKEMQSCFSTYYSIQVKVSEDNPTPAPGIVGTVAYLHSDVSLELKSRIPYGVSAIPQSQLNIDPYKIADLSAIALQMLKGRLRDMKRLRS